MLSDSRSGHHAPPDLRWIEVAVTALAVGTTAIALALVLLLTLARISGRHLPRQLGTGRCWHCGAPAPSTTGICAPCEKDL